MHHKVADKAYREKGWQQQYKNAASCIEQNLEATSHKAATIPPPASHL